MTGSDDAGRRRDQLDLRASLRQLGDELAAPGSEDRADEPHLNEQLEPVSDAEMLERIRELERRTGEQLIFPRSERPEPS